MDESYFGGRRKGRRGRGAAGKVVVFGILKRNGRVYTVVVDIVKSLIKSNESKEPKQQGIHISQPPWFPQPLDPCPHLLYRVEIRAIGWKPQHRMSLSLQRIQRVLPLVEGGVVHHDHAARG